MKTQINETLNGPPSDRVVNAPHSPLSFKEKNESVTPLNKAIFEHHKLSGEKRPFEKEHVDEDGFHQVSIEEV